MFAHEARVGATQWQVRAGVEGVEEWGGVEGAGVEVTSELHKRCCCHVCSSVQFPNNVMTEVDRHADVRDVR